jgi:hypothetical protein
MNAPRTLLVLDYGPGRCSYDPESRSCLAFPQLTPYCKEEPR